MTPRRRRRAGTGRKRPPAERPDLSALPDDPGVYVFRDARGRPLYVGKSVSVRSRARAHFAAPAGWTERAEVVDYRATNSELGALVLENRLIKRWRPAGNVRLKRSDGYVWLRARLDIPYPILDVGSRPADGRAVNVGPLRDRTAARELADELSSLFGLRHCGRALRRRDHPSAYGQMGRCLSPCLGDLDPNAYRRRLDEALAHFDAPDGAQALIERLDRQLAEAADARRYERAAVLLRRRERLARLLERLGGLLEAVHARSRLVCARHPLKDRWDAFWVVRGRIVEWGPLTASASTLAERANELISTAGAGAGRPHAVSPDEVDEIAIVQRWIATHDPPALRLDGAELTVGALERFLGEVTGPRSMVNTSDTTERGAEMGLMDKITGRAKQAAGDVTGDASMRREGRKEERKGDAKDELANAQDHADRKADEVANLERKTD